MTSSHSCCGYLSEVKFQLKRNLKTKEETSIEYPYLFYIALVKALFSIQKY